MAGEEGSGGSGNISAGGGNERSSSPKYPVERDETFVQRYYEELRCREIGRKMMPQVDTLPFFLSGDVTEVVDQIVADLAAGFQSSNSTTPQPKVLGQFPGLLTAGFLSSNASQVAPPQLLGMVASVMTSGLQVPINHFYGPQQGGSDDDDTRINIDTISGPPEVPTDEPLDMPITVSSVHLTTALWILALLTLIFVTGTTLYQPAMGVVFGSHKVGYYPTLAAIFTSGVIEAFIAFWLSRSRNINQHRFSFGRATLCFSIGPFVAIVGISGFSFIKS